TLPTRHATGFRSRARPFAPRMVVHRVRAQWRKLPDEAFPHRHRERRGNADMLEPSVVIVPTEPARADCVLAALVQTKSGDNALRRAHVLDLDHRALTRLVHTRLRLGDHTVQASSFEAREPFERNLSVARNRCEIHRTLDGTEQLFQCGAPL